MQQRSGSLLVARRERGAVLLLATVVVLVLLIGGLAVVAITSSELAGTAGYRSTRVVDACAEAGLENIRAEAANLENASQASGTLSLGGSTVSYSAGHYDGESAVGELHPGVGELDASTFDFSALLGGQNITNQGWSGGSQGSGQRVLQTVAVCGGDGGYREQEMQMIFIYGTPAH